MTRFGRRAFIAAIAVVGPMFSATSAQSVSIDDFLALSSRLTGHSTLDRGTAAIFLKNLLAEPGNAARLIRPDAALERDIILAWYTGMQEVRGEMQTVTHTGALQWRTLGMPAPGTCVGSFGTWSKPPRPPER
jgi:D-sorbitol dehydrogenase-like protein